MVGVGVGAGVAAAAAIGTVLAFVVLPAMLRVEPPDPAAIDRLLEARRMLPVSRRGNATAGGASNFWVGGDWEVPITLYGPLENANQGCHAIPDRRLGRAAKHQASVRADRTRIVIDEACDPKLSQLDAGTCVQTDVGKRRYIGCMPSLLIFGYQKCATAELQSWLSVHPVMHRWKGNIDQRNGAGEADFFKLYAKDLATAERHWKSDYLKAGLMLTKASDALNTYTFEKSPNYGALSQEHFAVMQKIVPSVKLIGLARNPVARAYSGFQHTCMKGRVFQITPDMPMTSKVPERVVLRRKLAGRVVVAFNASQAIENLHARFGRRVVYEQHLVPLTYPCTPQSFSNFMLLDKDHQFSDHQFSDAHLKSILDLRAESSITSILTHGLYASELKRILASYPQGQVGLIVTEDFLRNTVLVLDRVQRYLGVPWFDYGPFVTKNGKGHTVPSFAKSKATSSSYLPMSSDVAALLQGYYAPHNAELAEMVRSGKVVNLATTRNGWWF